MLDDSPLSTTQIIAIALTAVINAIDAYDVLSMSFVAPVIAKAWGIDKAALGLVLSSGFFGMVFGSLFIAPLADRFGRRPLILATLALMALGMTMAAFAPSVTVLALWRVVTGLGIGALVPINTPLVVEYANFKRRRLALAIMSIGFPLGSTLGGFAAAALIAYSRWQSVFLVGAVMSATLFVVALRWLPEPPAFLLARRPANALLRLNTYLVRCGHAPLDRMPEAEAVVPGRPYRTIFSKPNRLATIVLSSANFLYLLTVYYVLSWMPQLVADLGYSSVFATITSSVAALFGILAILSFSVFAARLAVRKIALFNMAGLAVAVGIFGLGDFGPVMLLALSGFVGVFLYAGGVALYGLIVDSFSPGLRATGVGFALGMGRVAGAIAPALAGQMFAVGVNRLGISITFAVYALAAAALVTLKCAR